jgi:Glyoxalase superfamily protein
MRPSIETLKRQAKRLKNAMGCSHSEALDELARASGFNNWSLLMKHCHRGERPVMIHQGLPREALDRYIELTHRPHPTRVGWWDVTLAVHDGDAEIDLEVMGEAMKPAGAKVRAKMLAHSKGMADVVIRRAKVDGLFYYNLKIVADHRVLSEPCVDDEQALAVFGTQLGVVLAFDGDGAPDYLLGRRGQSLGWVNPTIPVYRIS